MPNYAIWILAALLSILKLNIFKKVLHMMLKNGLTHQTIMKMIKDQFLMVWVKKVIGLFKDELGEKTMIIFVGLRQKAYPYLMDDDSKHQKAKGTKKWVIKRILKFNDYENCLFKNEIILKLQQRFKS